MSFFRRLTVLPSLVLLCAAATLPVGCLLDWEEKDTVVQECPASTSCELDCTDVERCLVQCAAGSACTVTCANTEDCIVECASGSNCDVECQDAGGCSLDCESGSAGTCNGACDVTNINGASCE